MTKEDFFDIDLVKWPAIKITGTPITKEQAIDIIRRTDSFFNYLPFGNNHRYVEEMMDTLNFPKYNYKVTNDSKYFEKVNKYQEKIKWINLEFLSNDWLSCCGFYGANGWCHPDGKIGLMKNIGKYPTVEEVYDELTAIAKNFPYLELECTLMNGEVDSYTKPMISFLVRQGKVIMLNPSEISIHTAYNRNKNFINGCSTSLLGYRKENFFSLTDLKDMMKDIENE